MNAKSVKMLEDTLYLFDCLRNRETEMSLISEEETLIIKNKTLTAIRPCDYFLEKSIPNKYKNDPIIIEEKFIYRSICYHFESIEFEYEFPTEEQKERLYYFFMNKKKAEKRIPILNKLCGLASIGKEGG